MNRKSAVLTLSIGIACAIVAVALALDLGGISSVLPIAAKGVWGFAGCAAALLVCSDQHGRRAHDHRRRGRSLDRLFRADRPHAADHVALAQDPALLSS